MEYDYPHEVVNGDLRYVRANCPPTCSSVTGTGFGAVCRCGCEKPAVEELKTADIPCGVPTVREACGISACTKYGGTPADARPTPVKKIDITVEIIPNRS